MAIEITDDGATIQFVDTVNDKTVNFNKRGTSLRQKGTRIEIIDNEYSEEFEFADVTIPATASPEDLIAAIEVFLETPAGGGGGGGVDPVGLKNIAAATINPATEDTLSALLTAIGLIDFATQATLLSVDTRLTGSERTIDLVEATSNGSTDSGVQSVSLLVRGTDGSIDGTDVPNNYSVEYTPIGTNDTVGSIAYTVPTDGEARILIAYVR